MADLVDAVWSDVPPATAGQQIYSTVSTLRRTLRDAIVKRPAGYELSVPGESIDAVAFEARAAQARRAASRGEPEHAVDLLNQALLLWRGPALDGLSTGLVDAVRLNESRLAALEERIAIELRLGRHADLVAELSGLVASHPLRERMVGQLMAALYRCGRTAEALDVFQVTAKRLAAELGLDPAPELRRVELAVLRGEPVVDTWSPQPAAAVKVASVVPAQLPVAVGGFAGRGAECAHLDTLRADRRVGIGALIGAAGAGKTALAVHWAHHAADRFPDGQLFVDLRGFSRSGPAVAPTQAVRDFLEALGVSAQQIPTSAEARFGLYRSLLAGRRVLVVLDNARDADQVRPLLPAGPGCMAVVTSRNQMSGLVATDGARPLPVGLLDADAARELLIGRLGPTRVAAEPDAVDSIVTRCAGLPLALAVVAARAATHPHFPLAVLAAQLGAAGAGLDAFTGGDRCSDIRTVFASSYRTLSPAGARLFRLLGLHPGPTFSAAAAASLAGLPVSRVRPLLAELARGHLISEPAPGRFTLHNLLRAYAGELARTHDAAEAPEQPARGGILRPTIDRLAS